jgi:hypothetical protein
LNPNALHDGLEDTVGVMKTLATGAALYATFQVLKKTRAAGLVCCRALANIVVVIIIVVVGVEVSVGVVVFVRANSHSPPSIRAACAKLLKTPWEL